MVMLNPFVERGLKARFNKKFALQTLDGEEIESLALYQTDSAVSYSWTHASLAVRAAFPGAHEWLTPAVDGEGI